MTRRTAIFGISAATALGSRANSAVSIGIIGTGRRGRYVGAMFARDPRARIVAISDLYDDQIDAAKTEIPTAAQARVYKDYHELLAHPGLDAVYIATPVFCHPEHLDAAVRAKKHVYGEKPAAADVAGVKRILRTAEAVDSSKHTVFGFQRRYSAEYREAAGIVASGRLGALLLMKSTWVSWGCLRKPFTPNPAWKAEERRMRYWPHFRETSGDFIVEQDCHGVDVLNWFSGAHPLKATGTGGRGQRAYGDNLDQVLVTYTYPNGLAGWLAGTQLCKRPFSDVKEQFAGVDGTLETHLHYMRWHRDADNIVERKNPGDVTNEAVADFIATVAAGRAENTIARGCESTFTALLGRLAVDRGGEVTWEELLATA